LTANLVWGGSDPMRRVRPIRHKLDDLGHQSLPAVFAIASGMVSAKVCAVALTTWVVGLCKLRGPRGILPASCTRRVGVSGPRQRVFSLIVDSVHNWTHATWSDLAVMDSQEPYGDPHHALARR
jgi:hypothetical protein